MKRVLACFFALCACLSLLEAAAPKPNLLLILADDMGYADCGAQGGTDFPTPHLDSIATGGVRCTQGYVSAPVCSPSRAGLMTGRYQQRFGHELNLGDGRSRDPVLGLPVREITLAKRLQDAGYATGLVGKWHLGSLPQFHPNARGFDEFFGFLMGQHGYFPGPLGERESPIERNGQIVETRKYLTEEFADAAVEFIAKHREQPFFLYLAFNAPHVPLHARPEDLARVPHLNGNRRTYAAMMLSMDDAIGRVLASLREHGLERDTLVAFLSDNGGPPGNGSNNAPLRAHKAQTYEGGIRVPFFVKWPASLPAGKVYEHPVISLDVTATMLAAAGLGPIAELDGKNLVPYFSGENTEPPHEHLFWRFGQLWAARDAEAKVVRSGTDEDEAYAITADPGETKRQPLAVPLREAWEAWSRTLVKPLWGDPDRRRETRKKRQP